jgi:hypothetical protein
MWAKTLNGLAFLVLIWAIIKPEPYHYLVWTLVLLPIVTLGFIRHFDGALKLDERKTNASALPNVAIAFLLPCIGLALRAVIDFKILGWDNFWLPFATVSLSFFLLILYCAKDIRKMIGTALLLVIFCAVYGYATVISLNGILDQSPPTIYKASVIKKRISSGKHTSYYLRLSPWGPVKGEEEVDVGKAVYEKHPVGTGVEVIAKNGRLGIPWFLVR